MRKKERKSQNMKMQGHVASGKRPANTSAIAYLFFLLHNSRFCITQQSALRMDSSRDTKDFRLVYVRRRKGTGSTSRQIVPDLNENISLNPESKPPSPKTNASPERRKNTGFGKSVPDLNDTISLHPELNSSTPKTDGSREIGDAGRCFTCELGNDGKLICCGACPLIYHLECLGLKSAPGKEWRCPNCLIDDELSMPIKYLKNLGSKRRISSKKGKYRSCYSQKSKKQSTYAVPDNQV